MARLTKRRKAILGKVQPGRQYPVMEALQLLKDVAAVKFDESVEVAINLGIDPRK